MSQPLFLKDTKRHQVCANCGKPYMAHYGDRLRCDSDLNVDEPRWFPKAIADVLLKQARKIRRAQKKLAIDYAASTEPKEKA